MQSGFVPALDGGVIKSDSCILPLLRTGLQKAIADMDSGRRTKSDGNILQHPVDPYYCAYAFEKTRTLRSGSLGLENCIASIGQGSTVAMPSEGDCVQSDPAKYPNDRAWSRRFQWLPFDIAFDRSKSWRSRYAASYTSPLSEFVMITDGFQDL